MMRNAARSHGGVFGSFVQGRRRQRPSPPPPLLLRHGHGTITDAPTTTDIRSRTTTTTIRAKRRLVAPPLDSSSKLLDDPKFVLVRQRSYYYHRSLSSSSTASSHHHEDDWTVDPVTGLVSHRSNSQDQPTYQAIVGLEVHVQLSTTTPTPSKLFSPSAAAASSFTHSAARPNSWFHPHDAGVPGYLPRLSRHAVALAVRAALCCNADLQLVSRFERKHYWYADLPLGYQITQQRWPLALNGYIPIQDIDTQQQQQRRRKKNNKRSTNTPTEIPSVCRIERIQLEMDTAKTTQQSLYSFIDFDRAGMPLVEIVTAPDLRSPVQARNAAQYLHHVLTTSGVTQGRMQHGELRIDVNVNLQQLESEDGDHHLMKRRRTSRVEVKNLNSFAQVQASIMYEAVRQASVFDDESATTVEETRTWDANRHETVLIRRKDTSQDYRFLPEPDLPPLVLTQEWIDEIQQNMPELPEETQPRLVRNYGISDYQAQVLVNATLSHRFDAVHLLEETCRLANASSGSASKMVANLICNDLFALIHQNQRDDDDDLDSHGDERNRTAPITPQQLSEIVTMLQEQIISTRMAKNLLALLVQHPDDYGSSSSPRQVAADLGWQLVTDANVLQDICRLVLDEHPTQVVEYHSGQHSVLKLFMGKAMEKSKGNAHPERLRDALLDVLLERKPS